MISDGSKQKSYFILKTKFSSAHGGPERAGGYSIRGILSGTCTTAQYCLLAFYLFSHFAISHISPSTIHYEGTSHLTIAGEALEQRTVRTAGIQYDFRAAFPGLSSKCTTQGCFSGCKSTSTSLRNPPFPALPYLASPMPCTLALPSHALPCLPTARTRSRVQ